MSALTGKRVLVTGAARGLGRAFAEALCAAGARVVIADILEVEGEATIAALRARGHDAAFRFIDLADPEAVELGVGAATQWLGGLDGVVNNAAIATGLGGRRFDGIEPVSWERGRCSNL